MRSLGVIVLAPLLVTCAAATGPVAELPATDAPRLLPVDEAPADASFASFRRELLVAVERRDRDALVAALDPNVRISFGGDGGRDAFIAQWKLDEPGSPLWDELEWILTHGGTFRGEGSERMFWAPYVYSAWPPSFDAFQHAAIAGRDVPLRDEPREDARELARLSYEIVLPLSESQRGWREIETAGGTRGWIPRELLRSPIGYRAGFHRRGARWRLAALVAGD